MSTNMYLTKLLQRNIGIQKQSQENADIKHIIYTKSKWLEHEVDFAFLLTTNNKNYRGRLSNNDIKLAAEELDRNYQEFYEECKLALTANISEPGFDYELDTESLVFKLIKCQGFETIYLDVKLREVENSFDLLDSAIDLISGKNVTNKEVNSNGIIESAKYQTLLQEYEKFVLESKLQERKLLKKFILLLNSKKEKINDLEEQIRKFQRGDLEATKMEDDDEDEENLDRDETSTNADDTIYLDDTQAMTPSEVNSTKVQRKRPHMRIGDSTDEE